MAIVKLKATDGTPIEYDDERKAGSGGVKDVYFSPDSPYVVAVIRNPEKSDKVRLKKIVGDYYQDIIKGEYGDYWQTVFNWPTKLIDQKGGFATKRARKKSAALFLLMIGQIVSKWVV